MELVRGSSFWIRLCHSLVGRASRMSNCRHLDRSALLSSVVHSRRRLYLAYVRVRLAVSVALDRTRLVDFGGGRYGVSRTAADCLSRDLGLLAHFRFLILFKFE
jgi:hypothetical protein